MRFQKQTDIKILIAPDKFKGSLTSAEASAAIQRGYSESLNYINSSLEEGEKIGFSFTTVEIADGGDGSLQVLQNSLSGAHLHTVKVQNPIGKMVDAQILMYEQGVVGPSCGDGENLSGGAKCAFIEMAKISGLAMLPQQMRNPLHTSTYGLGEAVLQAEQAGATQITLSIGGSATNDGGAGMLQALGFKFYNSCAEELPAPITGGKLNEIVRVEAPDHKLNAELNILCDVTNPLLGSEGATAVYGPQKGADEQALKVLEEGLANYAAVAERDLGVNPQLKLYPGAGAAGGVGYAGVAFLGAKLIPGWEYFTQVTHLEEKIAGSDIVITGEGSVDSQSLCGKVIYGVKTLAQKYNKPLILFCGVSKLTPDELEGIKCYSIASIEPSLQKCMENATELLTILAKGAAEKILEQN